MIKSFKSKEEEKLFNDYVVKRFNSILRSARMKLEILNAAVALDNLRVSQGNRLESLRGDLKGQPSIRINSQWRICFVWKKNNAYDVETVNYH
jgi:proteic killer suppression protein